MDCRRRDPCSHAPNHGDIPAEGVVDIFGGCPVLPDVEEERMLRALVFEGAALAHRGPFIACFRRWCIRVSREGRAGARFTIPIRVEIRGRHGELLDAPALFAVERTDEVAARRPEDDGRISACPFHTRYAVEQIRQRSRLLWRDGT